MRKLLDTFFHNYLSERNLQKTMGFFTEDVISIGTGKHEIAHSKKELMQLMINEFATLPMPLNYRIFDYIELPVAPNVRNIFAQLQVHVDNDGFHSEMLCRLTCTFLHQEEDWKISCVHLSVASAEQEENSFFPLHYGNEVADALTPDSETTLMELISASIPGGIMGGFLEPDFPLYTINDKMLNILGYTFEELIEATDEKMINIIYEEDREATEQEILRQFEQKDEYEVIYRAVGKGNRLIWINDIGKKILTEEGREAMISVMTDITTQMEEAKRLKAAAELDSLTGLYNRNKIISIIDEEFSAGKQGTLFICDIDNFKHINDTRGHIVGDDVLKELATLFQKKVGTKAVAARLGGDEFALFVFETVSSEDAIALMRQIQFDFLQYVKELVPDLHVSLSAGGAFRNNNEPLRKLYQRADDALYLAKQYKGDLKIL